MKEEKASLTQMIGAKGELNMKLKLTWHSY